jgi:hypothetical protein
MNLNICITKAVFRALAEYGARRLSMWQFRVARTRLRQARLRRPLLV